MLGHSRCVCAKACEGTQLTGIEIDLARFQQIVHLEHEFLKRLERLIPLLSSGDRVAASLERLGTHVDGGRHRAHEGG